ncbi:MAG: protein kinase [bacterium]
MIRLGPLQFTDKLGAGAMGVVWRAAHRGRDLPVAVKVLRPTRDPKRQAQAFKAEVRAMARLDHPSIAYVHEAGFAPKGTAERTGNLIADGAPFLVMDLLEGPSLQRFRGRLPWPQLRAVLLGLLDALAHAHARGVLHLDLKPANIIADPVRWTVRLTDFGLARLREDEGDDERLTGTPAFMAPEQVQGRGRTMGPWTDLYAVGCLAWCLASGRSPFARPSVHETLLAQLGDETPPLEARHPMPDGSEEWVDRLLAKSPRARYRHTADAAWALARLATPPEPPGPITLGPVTIAPDEVEPGPGSEESTLVEPVIAGHVDDLPDAPTRTEAPPLPPAPPRPRQQRRRLGAGLFDLRPLPLVGRELERERLWTALTACHADRTARGVVISGRGGVGKTRLVEWLGTTASEVGGATVLKAIHSAEPGTGFGLGPMFGRALRCERLGLDAIPMQLLATLGTDAAADALDWRIWSDLIGGVPMPRAARHGAALGLLRALVRERPVILWIDDAQWAPDSLAFVEGLLEPGLAEGLPVLVVCTVTDDEVDSHPEAGPRLASLAQRGLGIALEPLPPDDMTALVRALADLDERTVMQVAERAAGHPQFAVQLVRHWAAQGLLVPTPDGVGLPPGARVELPADLQDVWRERLDRLLDGRPAAEAIALELAATLGLEVEEDEWQAAAALAAVDLSAELLSALLDARFARHEEGSGRWAFGSAPFRETILGVARAAGRLARHHRTCAIVLDGRPGHAERAARHWMEAGEPEPAIAAFGQALEESADAGDLVRAGWLLDAQARALDAAGCGDGDPRRATYLLDRSRLLRSSGSAAEAELDARAALGLADEHDWPAIALDALEQLGAAQCEAGQLQAGMLTLERALRSPEPYPVPKRRMRLGLAFARAALQLGDQARASSAARGTFKLADQLGSDAYAAKAQMILAALARDGATQATALLEAETRFARSKHRTGLAEVHTLRGDLARAAGDFGAAETHYRIAAGIFRRMGSAHLAEPALALGLLLLDQGLLPEAERALEEAREIIESHSTRRLIGPVSLLSAAVAAERGQWDACDMRLDEASRNLLRSEVVSGDMARWAEQIAAAAIETGRTTIAARAHDIALAQHRALGDHDGVDRLLDVRRNLSRPPGGFAPPLE